MPINNTVKQFDSPAYYHVYNRGAGGQAVFRDDTDKSKFISLCDRYLDPANDDVDANGIVYEKYEVEVLAYCLMDNHFHIMLYQENDPGEMTKFMRSLCTAYTMYFNKRHASQGHLFQSTYKASRITSEPHLMHISRYIHMNPRSFIRYKWSSIGYYLGRPGPVWLNCERVNPMSPSDYREFLDDYVSRKMELKLIKSQLANL